jgi:hypothetical protein
VLFSNDKVAAHINRNFEPVWQSVAPVPKVHVDFGGGNRLTRTIGGNVATYICLPSGHVLDILPGAYDPATYVRQLDQSLLLARWVRRDRIVNTKAVLANYHHLQASTLKAEQLPRRIVARRSMSILATEGSIRYLLVDFNNARARLRLPERRLSGELRPIPELGSAEALKHWPTLAEETKLNESARRQKIHAYLADQELLTPDKLTNWVFREVLGVDLEAPDLGLTGRFESVRSPATGSRRPNDR